jgi:hypothetical protein
MGTRNLTAVMVNGKYKVAQYGQWDGYPDGQGLTALKFLRDTMNKKVFLDKLNNVRFVNAEELHEMYISMGSDPDSNWLSDEVVRKFNTKWPHFSRDNGAKILEMIQDSDGEILLYNQIEFAGDSLFCEWAWVIDFDKGTFEGYKGFNSTKMPIGERFSDIPYEIKDKLKGTQYYPIQLAATFSLDALPTNKEFLDVFVKIMRDNV